MILNPWTVSAFFLATVGLVLSALAVVLGMRAWLAGRRSARRAVLESDENRTHLLVLAVVVLAIVRLIAWPQFYLLLESYVPELASVGVMCAFGVTRVQAPLVATLEWLKPLVLFGLGLWWLVIVLEHRAHEAALRRARHALAIPVAAAAGIECALEIAYLVRDKLGTPVTCCTQFLQLESAQLSTSAWTPAPLSGLDTSLTLYLAASALTATAAQLAVRATRRSHATVWLAALAALAIANLAVTHSAWLATLAPRVLGLPYHHCIYELLTDTPALGAAALMAVAGGACLVWPVMLVPWRWSCRQAVVELQAKLCSAGAVLTASSLLVVLVHVI